MLLRILRKMVEPAKKDQLPGTLAELGDEPFCYLTTVGRVTGRPRTIEIWFAVDGTTVYVLSGGGDRSDWVKNVRRNPDVRLRIGPQELAARARFLDDPAEDARARSLAHDKYQPRYGGDLSGWRERSLPVAFDVA